ncbi:MAG TPA: hypothetical protein VHK47_24005 [Polyangia bacterium]|jgi:hypothetical protein|nr:hypothetical protein [Polyangia bacterium]
MTKMATWLLAGALGLGFAGGRAMAAEPDNDTDDTNAPSDTGANRASDTGNTAETSPKGTQTTATELQMSDLPSAVRSTFKREAKGGKVEELRKETKKDGSVVYEGEIVKKGQGRELEVNSDGMVVDRGKSHNEKMEPRGSQQQ